MKEYLHTAGNLKVDYFIDHDPDFFSDSLDLFLEMRSGHVGRYLYGEETPNPSLSERQADNWAKVADQNNSSYYLPSIDQQLLLRARKNVLNHIPLHTSVVDFGVGDLSAFEMHILPFLSDLKSRTYYAIDICKNYLESIEKIQPHLPQTRIVPKRLNFFSPNEKTLSANPALGIMTCSTIGNIEGSLRGENVGLALTAALKSLSTLTSHGWLLTSVDTNQNADALMKGYATPVVERFVLTVMRRIAAELPTVGFDPSLFRYAPEWHPDRQLFAHMAEATETQRFWLGSYQLEVKKGQKLHLLNSYKFAPDFFESCCDKANMDVLEVWHHESPMKLYLLVDRANPLYRAKTEA